MLATMPRILLLIILLWILYIVFKRFVVVVKNHRTKTNQTSATPENIVACSQCGVHVPENEVQLINDTVYCNNPACKPKQKN